MKVISVYSVYMCVFHIKTLPGVVRVWCCSIHLQLQNAGKIQTHPKNKNKKHKHTKKKKVTAPLNQQLKKESQSLAQRGQMLTLLCFETCMNTSVCSATVDLKDYEERRKPPSFTHEPRYDIPDGGWLCVECVGLGF